MSHEPMSIHPNHVDGYQAAGFTVNYPRDTLNDTLKAAEKSPLPWSDPDADPLKDMYEVGEASRKSWPFL